VPRVSFQPSGRSVEVPAGSRLLDAVLAAGLPIARACGADGLCGRCGVRVLRGGATGVDEADPAEAAVRSRNRLDLDLRLACRVRVLGDVEIAAPYW
jgi:2Fe-2S ferredoxin